MKSFAVKEKRTTSATRKAHQYTHQPLTKVHRSNQAVVQEILQSTAKEYTPQNQQDNKDNNAVLPLVQNKQQPKQVTPDSPPSDNQAAAKLEPAKGAKQKGNDKKAKVKEVNKVGKGGKTDKKDLAVVEDNYPTSPDSDPAFKKLKNRVNKTAKSQKKTDKTAKEESQAAQSAASIANNEVKGKAQENQVNDMSEKEPGEFNAEAFKLRLMKRIEGMRLPKNQDEAGNFEDNNNIQEISNATAVDTSKEREKTAAPISSATNAELDMSDKAVAKRVVTPLRKAPVGAAPKSIHANSAMPKTRPESQVSQPLQSNMKEVDQQMLDNEVTEHQLTIANEPTFSGALGERDKARTNTATAPVQFRQQETTALTKTQQGAKSKGLGNIASMHQSRGGLLNAMVEQQVQTGTKDSAERERISTTINGFYQTTKSEVEALLASLDTEVSAMFDSAALAAKKAFEDYVKREVAAYKSRRYSGGLGLIRWGRDKFKGLPDAVNKYFVTGREMYIAIMDTALTNISALISTKLTAAKNKIALGKKNVDEFVGELKGSLAKFGQEAADDIQTKFDQLTDSVNSKQEDLIDSLAQKYTDSLSEVDARIDEMKAANRGLIDKALDAINGVIDTIKKLKQLISDLLSSIKSVLPTIMKDPNGFASKLFSGVKQGFNNFKENIKEHLLSGFIKWLTGAMGPVNITILDNLFSLKGIFSLVGQVLGVTWDYVRKKAIRLIGAPVVKAMETSFAMFQTIRQIILTDGIVGVWQYIKDQFTDLKEVVIDAIQNMLITKVITAGIKWLLGLLIPGAGFIKAVMAIKDFIVFFVESALMLIPTLIKAIKAMASGNISGVATAVEKGLAILIPAVISLFAKIIGLGSLVERVQKIIKKIRKRIDRAINKLIKKIQKSFRKMVNKGKAKVKKVVGAIFQWWKVKKKISLANGEKHTLFFKGVGKKAVLFMRSKELSVEERINKLPDGKKKTALAQEYKNNVVNKTNAIANEGKNLSKAKQNKLQKEIGLTLVSIGKKLGDAGKAPPTAVTHSTEGGKAAVVTAAPLSKVAGNTKGSAASGQPLGWNIANWENSNTKRTTSSGKVRRVIKWRRVHMLSHQLHGPGDKAWNLTPTNQTANSLLATQENKVYSDIKTGGTFYKIYKITAQYNHPDISYTHTQAGKWNKNQFPSKITLVKQKDGESSAKTIPISNNLPAPDPNNTTASVDYGEKFKQNIDMYFADTAVKDRMDWSRFLRNRIRFPNFLSADEKKQARSKLKAYYLQNQL